MEYEYVALSCFNLDTPEADTHFTARYANLQTQGWQELGRAPWQVREDASGAVIMRRPKDEPRMWTEAELQDLMKETWVVGGNANIKEESNG